MGDRQQFDAELAMPVPGVSSERPTPFTEQDEGASFMTMMQQQMPGRAG